MQQEGFELPEDGVFQITLQKAVGKPQKIEYIGVFEPLSSCRVSLLIGLGLLILKDFHAWEPLKFCFIEYTFAVIKTPRAPHFPSRNQHYVLDSTRLPF